MNYSYTVTRVDNDAKCMDVEFTAAGFAPVVVGVRLPTRGENVDLVIQSFAPHSTWNPPVIEYTSVAVGTSGSYTAPSTDQVQHMQQENENATMWAKVEFEKQIAEVLVKFGILSTDPTKIPVQIL